MNLEIRTANRLQQIIDHVETQPKLVNKAIRRTMRATSRWLKTRIASELASQMGITQKGLKNRFVLSTVGKGKNQKFIFWLGTYPLAAEQAGKPRKLKKKGIAVKKYRFNGAFHERVYGPSKHIWIRAERNRTEGDSGVSPVSQTPGNVASHLKSRFPVERIGIEIAPLAEALFRRYQARVNSNFNRILEQQLNYVLNVE